MLSMPKFDPRGEIEDESYSVAGLSPIEEHNTIGP
jgi:hypothetical protein